MTWQCLRCAHGTTENAVECVGCYGANAAGSAPFYRHFKEKPEASIPLNS